MSFRRIARVASCRLGVLFACTASLCAQTVASAETAHPAAAPFGGLSLFILAGTLLAGLLTGAGVATLRNRQPSLRLNLPRLGRSSSGATRAAPPVVREEAAPRVMPDASPVREKLPPVVAVLGPAGESDCDDWLDALADGPRFGPRIVGLIAAADCDRPQAIATIADHARTRGQDVVIIDAGGDMDRLAEAFDRRIGRRSSRQSDPFGASARIEVVEEGDLFTAGPVPTAQDWRKAFASLAARNDIVLVDLPSADRLAEVPALIEALDDAVILRDAALPRPDVAIACQAARQTGARVTAQVVIDDHQAEH